MVLLTISLIYITPKVKFNVLFVMSTLDLFLMQKRQLANCIECSLTGEFLSLVFLTKLVWQIRSVSLLQ